MESTFGKKRMTMNRKNENRIMFEGSLEVKQTSRDHLQDYRNHNDGFYTKWGQSHCVQPSICVCR